MITLSLNQLKNLFTEYNAKYFNNLLSAVTLEISNRHTRGKFGHCKFKMLGNAGITLFAPILSRQNNEGDWKATLLHEMVHASLYIKHGRHGAGHTSLFKATLTSIYTKEFGNVPRYTNVRFHFSPQTVSTPVTPVQNHEAFPLPILQLKPVYTVNRYKVLSTGKIGEFLKETVIYGKKHVSLKIEGMLFPFTTNLENVVPA